MEALIKNALNTSTLKQVGRGGGGCINVGESYVTDQGTKVFVKRNSKSEARQMFDGELAGLNAIISTGTVCAPKPIVVLDNPRGGSVLVMEHLDMMSLNRCSAQLGQELAQLHLHNTEIKKNLDTRRLRSESDAQYVDRFGFHFPTCCGFIPQDNSWCNDWVEFYSRQKLDLQIRLLEKGSGDREALELWSHLKLKLPSFFKDIKVTPALLHGDLWGGNVAEADSRPVIFDPATFYGHSEFELAIAGMFGGFNRDFYEAYHRVLPQAPGFEPRKSLYQLFHYLNHWNHFGSGYRGSSISIMKRLIKSS